MKLSHLLNGIVSSEKKGLGDPKINSIECDSRKVRPGALFVAISGYAQDGHRFLEEAIQRGAAALVVERDGAAKRPAAIPVVTVNSTREVLGRLAAVFYGEPARRLEMIGVTGTSGKTTTTYLIRQILNQAGRPAGLLGTVEYDVIGTVTPSQRTTPGPVELQQYLAQIEANGGRAAVMEVSSHALDQGRVKGIDFDSAVFTNLTQDHLDYHRDMESYFAAKTKLFLEELPASRKRKKWSAVNTDDPYGKRLWEKIDGNKFSYGFGSEAHFRATDVKINFQGTSFQLISPLGNCAVQTHLIGRHNVYNLLAAAAATAPLGLGWKNFADAVKEVAVPGRLEPIRTKKGSAVFIDYAHCADALEKALKAVRPLTDGKLIVVFGCGGDRDQGKREIMGEVAGRLADHVIVTSDNPRGENPMKIIAAVVRGLERHRASFEMEVDREKAIEKALQRAENGDAVLIAGKGHEREQIFRDRVVAFDDKKVAEFYGQAVV